MPCATWSWLQRTKPPRRQSSSRLAKHAMRALRGIHVLSFIGCCANQKGITNIIHRHTCGRDIRLCLDGIVDHGLLWWVSDCRSLGERGVESNGRAREPVDDLLACDVEVGLTLYKGGHGKCREREHECDEGCEVHDGWVVGWYGRSANANEVKWVKSVE
jgi:hypothetical protein